MLVYPCKGSVEHDVGRRWMRLFVPVGFHFMILLNSTVSCSSVHGSVRRSSSASSADTLVPCGVFGWASATGVDALLAAVFARVRFREGMIVAGQEDVWR